MLKMKCGIYVAKRILVSAQDISPYHANVTLRQFLLFPLSDVILDMKNELKKNLFIQEKKFFASRELQIFVIR